MLTSDDQRRHTRQKLAELESLMVATEEGRAGDDGFRDLQLAGLRSQAEDLHAELAEFDRRLHQP